jgi:hypothetical protein
MQLGDEGARAPIVYASARTITPKMRQNETNLYLLSKCATSALKHLYIEDATITLQVK